MIYLSIATLASTLLLLTGCTPSVKVEAPDKPIVVHMNVNIEHKVKVKVKRDLDNTINKNPEIF
jgi:hypothetical protein